MIVRFTKQRNLSAVAFLLLAFTSMLATASRALGGDATVIVVAGAEGAEEYREAFRESALRWQQAAERGGATCYVIGLDQDSEKPDRDQLREQLQQAIAANNNPHDTPIWIVLIGHGTFYRDTAKFNARGPDFSASELAQWLSDSDRPLVVINGASSSGPFINRLSRERRIIVTATKSGAEQNYARFGEFISASITDPEADLDHDEEVSVLEAFLHAADRTAKFYSAEARLATEHPLIDDNGDGRGTTGDFFRGVRAVKQAAEGATVDGELARRMILVPASDKPGLSDDQRSERARLEAELEQLRRLQGTLAEPDYLDQLEAVLLPLARLQNAQSESE